MANNALCFACPTCMTYPLETDGKIWRCPQCGAEYSTWGAVPVLFPKEEISAEVNGKRLSLDDVRDVYDTAYRHNGLMGTDFDKTYDEVTKRTLLGFGEPLEGKRVLDLGTGSGNLWAYVSEDVEGYAIDLSPVGVARTIERFPWLVATAAVAESLPFPNDFFDVVIAADSLEHTFDPQKTLSEVRRVLRPGGILSASFPIPDSLRKWGWNQLVTRRFNPKLVFNLASVVMNRIRLFGRATFQPIDRDLEDKEWLAILHDAGFTTRQLISWPEAPQAPIVYLVHAECLNDS